ncbi:MAG: tetratricopeptide repeat protein [Bryobacteraceae bacterium]
MFSFSGQALGDPRSGAALVMVTVLLGLGLLWQSVSPELAQHVQAGMEARDQHRLNDAIKEFRKVTELAPDLAAGFVNLGAACLESKDYRSAIPALKRALDLNPQLVGAEQMLGYALLAQGSAEEAIPHLERANAQDALGIAQLKTGKFPDAVKNLEAALSKRPNDPDLLYYLGRASGLLSKNAFDTLETAYPDAARAHQALGDSYAAVRQVPQAEKEYRDALRLRPDTPGIHLSLGQLYATASQWPQAETEFAAEAKLQPEDAETIYRLGNALLQQGKLKEGREQLEHADRIRPHMPEVLYALGKAASAQGDAGAAERAWTELVSIEKDTALAGQAHFGLAGLYRKQGKTSEAQREMEQYRKLQTQPSAEK